MMQANNYKMRGVAILTGGVLAATMLFQPAPARADSEKEKLYKGGAAALGVLGAYWILKGKTIPGAIAGAGAYYAYKKGQEENEKDRYSDYYYRNDRRTNRRSERRNDYRSDDYRYDDYRYDYDRNDNRYNERYSDDVYSDYYDYSSAAAKNTSRSSTPGYVLK